jgi:hypothetical protein
VKRGSAFFRVTAGNVARRSHLGRLRDAAARAFRAESVCLVQLARAGTLDDSAAVDKMVYQHSSPDQEWFVSMPTSRQRTLWQPLRRRLFGAVALVAYFAAAIGVPLPVFALHDLGQPGSQKGPCGCPVGEQVSGHCCCSGPDEQSPWTTIAATDQAEGTSCTSCAKAPKACCSSHANAAPQTQPSQSKPSSGKSWVLRVSAATCQCTSTVWITMGEVCPPPPLLVWVPYLLATDRVSSPDTTMGPVTLSPPDPPPRFLGA